MANQFTCVKSVSYTHLDVYKRQKFGFAMSKDEIIAWSHDNEHSFAEPNSQEIAAFECEFENCDPWVIGNYPKWLDDELQKAFGDNRGAELSALSKPAPLDFRANSLKTNINNLIKELSTSPKLQSEIVKTPLSKIGARLAWSNGRAFPFAVEPSFLRGEFEVQDEASQLCAQLTGAKEGQRIADVCAGGGGKTLALAALTNNKAKLIAYDTDPNRIAPIYERLRRADAKADVRTDRRGTDTFSDINGKCDVVLVDAPCTLSLIHILISPQVCIIFMLLGIKFTKNFANAWVRYLSLIHI